MDRSTISRLFNYSLEFRGSLRMPNCVPLDKFKPLNILRLDDYRAVLQLLLYMDGSHRRLKLCGEKPIKGNELYRKKTRRNPITGEVPCCNVPSDFRNTYNTIGFCGVHPSTHPVHFEIHKGIADSYVYRAAIYNAIADGFLKPYDFLVVDNAAIHVGSANTDLRNSLFEEYKIILILLPTRCPELNPIKLVWNGMVQKMKRMYFDALMAAGPYPIARAAAYGIKEFTHHDIAKLYRHQGYLV